MPDDSPAGGRHRGWLSRPVLLAGTAVAAVAAGAGIAIAATSGPSAALPAARPLSAASTSPAPSPARPAWRPGCRRVVTPRRVGVLCAHAGFGAVLHGTFVLPKPGGGTVTVEIQRGDVTTVSSTAITLKSTDGFTRTYAVSASTIVDAQRDGIGSVKPGDQVWLAATASGGTVTAIRVMDLTRLRAEGLPWLRPAAGSATGAGASGALGIGGSSGSAASLFGGPAVAEPR